VETWERLQARLFHLGYLGEELPRVVSAPGVSAWLYRLIAAEAGEVVRLASDYITECERNCGVRSRGEKPKSRRPVRWPQAKGRVDGWVNESEPLMRLRYRELWKMGETPECRAGRREAAAAVEAFSSAV
jgi:hypothetical protein